jgi:hypothetical protein
MKAAHHNDIEESFCDDSEAVCFISSILEVSEYRLFEIAFVKWFGRETSVECMENYFWHYVETGFVPYWLRDLVRKALQNNTKGALNPQEYGIETRQSSPAQRRLGWVVITLLTCLLIIFCWQLRFSVSY